MIKTRGLVKKYGSFTAVDGVDLNIPTGEIYGLLGPNGAGKTSTIMMLLGIVKPTRGDIFLFGEPYNPKRLDLRKRIGVVPENHPHGMWSWMTAYEYLEMFAELFEVKDKERRIEKLLSQVRLSEVINKKIGEFSRGMLQKLSFVRALLHDPDILFLDEPISGLDPLGIKQIRDLILEENREGRTIFISSHLLSEMEKICHRVAIISRGRLMAEDRMESLLNNLSRERKILIDLESIPSELPDEVKRLSYVLDCRGDGNTLVITVPREGDYRKGLSEFLIKKNLIPLSIKEQMVSLEEAFVTITKENVEMLAAMGESR
ncbi:MAG: hypothetical protein DRP87_04585 [Spirochaetes bacterium]|nr:MAG: hypothetical protein DRP87_04585 [Spirochaetota bacterium]